MTGEIYEASSMEPDRFGPAEGRELVICDRAQQVIDRALREGWIILNGPSARLYLEQAIRDVLVQEVRAGGPWKL